MVAGRFGRGADLNWGTDGRVGHPIGHAASAAKAAVDLMKVPRSWGVFTVISYLSD